MKTYLSRDEALTRYPLTEIELNRLLDQGRVNTVNLLCEGKPQLIFYDDDLAAYVAERDITPTKFDHLRGNLLGIGEAAREYRINSNTISRWASQGKLEIKGEELNKKLVDEADVAYLAALGRAKKMRPGKKVFS